MPEFGRLYVKIRFYQRKGLSLYLSSRLIELPPTMPALFQAQMRMDIREGCNGRETNAGCSLIMRLPGNCVG